MSGPATSTVRVAVTLVPRQMPLRPLTTATCREIADRVLCPDKHERSMRASDQLGRWLAEAEQHDAGRRP
jgi:hypothetical protein